MDIAAAQSQLCAAFFFLDPTLSCRVAHLGSLTDTEYGRRTEAAHFFLDALRLSSCWLRAFFAEGQTAPWIARFSPCRLSNQVGLTTTSVAHPPSQSAPKMNCRVSYEHSLKSAPDAFIVWVPSQLVDGIPADVPAALLPEYITDLILQRSPTIGRIKDLRILG